MFLRTFGVVTVVGCVTLTAASSVPGAFGQDAEKSEKEVKRPSLTLKTNPNVAFAPARVTAVGELKGGPNDFEDYYCAGVEWDWGDGTVSAASTDCEPYEPGKSEIKRRFTQQHDYRYAGSYKIILKLMRKTKTLTTATANMQVRPGLNDPFEH